MVQNLDAYLEKGKRNFVRKLGMKMWTRVRGEKGMKKKKFVILQGNFSIWDAMCEWERDAAQLMDYFYHLSVVEFANLEDAVSTGILPETLVAV